MRALEAWAGPASFSGAAGSRGRFCFFGGLALHESQIHSPRGRRERPTQPKWNQLSQWPSHATISPK